MDHTNDILGAGADTCGALGALPWARSLGRVALGAWPEILLIIANVGSAVVLFLVLAITTGRSCSGRAGSSASGTG
jgi:hypothetical protein